MISRDWRSSSLCRLAVLMALCRFGPAAHAADHEALSGAAYDAARAAYQAYATKDFAVAAEQARQAIALRPDVARLRLLLIDAESAAGHDQQAWQADLDAVQHLGDQVSLRTRRSYIGARLAVPVSLAALTAAQQGAFDQAATLARQAIGYAPDRDNDRLQLIADLLAKGDLGGAEQAASDAIARVPDGIMPLVLRGYLRAARGDAAGADADFSRALALGQVPIGRQRMARVIIAEVWIARGDAQRALDLLAPLPALHDDIDTLILQRRFEAGRQLAQAGPAAAVPLDPAHRPIIDCYGEHYGAICDVVAADAGRDARRAYVDALNHGKRDDAVAFARQAVAAAPGIAQHRVDLIYALTLQGDTRAAALAARMAVDDGLLAAMSPLTAAYVATDADDSEDAARYFKRADVQHELTPSAYADAGYAAKHVHDNADAVQYFTQAIDAAQTPAGTGAEASQPRFTPQQMQDMRNSYADLTRNVGADVSVSSRGASLQSGGLPATASNSASNNSAIGAEAYWRPFGSLDERMFELYARTYEIFGVKGSGIASGVSSLDAALGARVRPFKVVDAVFAFERIVPIGSRTSSDWLARAAYSGGFGTERRLDASSWWTLQGYAEAGHYLRADTTYSTGYLELGRTFRASQAIPDWTVFPYLVGGADYNDGINHSVATGLGIGVSSRYWFRDGKYASARSFLDVTAQYRWKIAGDDRARGVFLGATLSY